MVMSLDGKITNGELPVSSWASSEDAGHFLDLKNHTNVIILGSSTFEDIKSSIQPNEKTLRIVLTSDPMKYQDYRIEGQLEFHNKTAEEIIKMLDERGYSSALLLSGEYTNTQFLRHKLIDELIITVEPILLGNGKQMFNDIGDLVSLRLISSKRLNTRGTQVLTYKVIK